MSTSTPQAASGAAADSAPLSTASDPLAGVLAGLVAGVAYLVAQMAFSAGVHGGIGWEPLQRISAMLLGTDVLPPPGDIDITIGGIGLLIHLGLAIVFGRVVDVVVLGRMPAAAVLRGALVGLALYGLNYWLLAPVAFPWFEDARGLTTLVDHLLFGAVAGAVYAHLRPRLQAARAAAARG